MLRKFAYYSIIITYYSNIIQKIFWQEHTLLNILVDLVIGRAQRARTSAILFVCMYVCMYVYMSSTDRGQCACVPAQRANVAVLASSARCARMERPQMLCILLVDVFTFDVDLYRP